jgi:hypothetical protein
MHSFLTVCLLHVSLTIVGFIILLCVGIGNDSAGAQKTATFPPWKDADAARLRDGRHSYPFAIGLA